MVIKQNGDLLNKNCNSEEFEFLSKDIMFATAYSLRGGMYITKDFKLYEYIYDYEETNAGEDISKWTKLIDDVHGQAKL